MTTDYLNDFPVSSEGLIDTFDLYASFLECEELAKRVPRKEFGNDPDFAFYKLLKEAHAAKSNKQAFYRKRGDAENALIWLWLSRTKETASIFGALNPLPTFRGISTESLSQFAKLSADPGNIKILDQILLDQGIILVYEPSIPGMKLDGAAFTIGSGNPVIALSLRYPRLDNFWFTLMHELAHVCLHYDRLETPILDDIDIDIDELVEHEANRLASSSLISRSAWRSCQAMYSQQEEEVLAFAEKVGVHPAIVAGRIRNELNRHDLFSRIINEVNVREMLLSNG